MRATPVSHGLSVGWNSPTISMALGEQCLQKAALNGADNKRKHAEKWVLTQWKLSV